MNVKRDSDEHEDGAERECIGDRQAEPARVGRTLVVRVSELCPEIAAPAPVSSL